jgi:aerobic-type carbon monoxide dehydrogenase small subunit (CoxS/CutS family)
MVSACKNGPMAQFTKASGLKDMLTAKEFLHTWMVMCMTECGIITKRMDSEATNTRVVEAISASGKKICNTEKAQKRGTTAQAMRVTTLEDKNTDLELTSGVTKPNILVNGKITRSTA